MESKFKKISVETKLHNRLKKDRKKFKLKSISATIWFYLGIKTIGFKK